MLPDSRGENYTFSSQFHGLREAIDHIVVGGSLSSTDVTSITYLNLNADFRDQTSDHNPVVLTLN
jgi:endonuclease/exonuclease/phosphatase family metal-dependent hydrolase